MWLECSGLGDAAGMVGGGHRQGLTALMRGLGFILDAVEAFKQGSDVIDTLLLRERLVEVEHRSRDQVRV